MARIYFDTNIFIYLHTQDSSFPFPIEKLERHELYVSTLTYHILAYVQRVKIPNQTLMESMQSFNIASLNEKILNLSLIGPTKDLEDNIQLHSAADKECEYFLTNDKALLKMKFFGKTKIVSAINP